MARHALPSDEIRLEGFQVNGRRVSYRGSGAVAFRVDARGELIAFAGERAKEITVDGRTWAFASKEMEEIAWAPAAESRRVKGGALVEVRVKGEGELRIPAAGLPSQVKVYAEGAAPGSRGARLEAAREGGVIRIAVKQGAGARRVFIAAE